MNSVIVAALIGAIVALAVGVITLVAALRSARITAHEAHKDTLDTLMQQRDALDKTSAQQRDALDKTLTQQRDALDKTLTQQRDALDKTLTQQSDALDRTLKDQNLRTLNERFATAADKLGNDKSPAVQLAGVYAMAGLADDWNENRQTCIAVLCSYLRMPYTPDPGPNPAEKQREFQGSREVRWTLMRVITEHLRDPQAGSDRKAAGVPKQVAPTSWQGENYFDFSGAVFDGGTFSDARFCGTTRVDFGHAEFSPSKSGKVSFHHAKFSGSAVLFHHARFPGGTVEFQDAEFSGGAVEFRDAEFSGGVVTFRGAKFSSGGVVSFDGAVFSGGVVSFDGTVFSGGVVTFRGAKFSSGGTVDFSHAADWSHPPKFDWEGDPPVGVKLPAAASGASQ